MQTLNVSYMEARSMLVYEYNHRVKGFSDREEQMWHKIRVHASILLMPQVKKGKSLRPQDLIKLPSDIKEPSITRERMIADMEAKTRLFLKYHRN